MGFASYFEDIWDRRDQFANEYGYGSIQGPAGTPPKVPNARLVPLFTQLELQIDAIATQIIQRYERQSWKNLSSEMDRLENEVDGFNRKTLMATERQLFAHSHSILECFESVLRRARQVIGLISHQTRRIAGLLEKIHQMRQIFGESDVSLREDELKQTAERLVRGWQLLKQQALRLEQHADDMRPVIVGKAFDRLMSMPTCVVIDKDAIRNYS